VESEEEEEEEVVGGEEEEEERPRIVDVTDTAAGAEL